MQSPALITFVMKTIAERLVHAREAAGLSQPQLAKKAGVSQGSISHIETGLRKNPRHLLSLAKALGITPDWLMNGSGPRQLPVSQQNSPLSAESPIAAYEVRPAWPSAALRQKQSSCVSNLVQLQINPKDHVRTTSLTTLRPWPAVAPIIQSTCSGKQSLKPRPRTSGNGEAATVETAFAQNAAQDAAFFCAEILHSY